MTRVLRVLLGNVEVGYLTNLPNDGTLFSLSDTYRQNPERATLSQSLYDDVGVLNDDAARPVQRLAPSFFANLLPEGRMRAQVARLLHVSDRRDFPLLEFLGENLLGAVRLESEEIREEAKTAPEALALALPGVALKLSALLEERDALTLPARDKTGEYIVKVSSGTFEGIIENEYSMLAFARAVGIDVPHTVLVEPQDIEGIPPAFHPHTPALAIRRFDRPELGRRTHIEDFNQVFAQFPDGKYDGHSYGDIAKLLRARVSQKDVLAFIERVVFNAAIGNGDMHLKNWSLIYHDGRTPSLAPAYDLVSTLPYDVDHDLALSFAGSKDRNVLTDDRLRRFSQKVELPARLVRKVAWDMAERMRNIWPTLDVPLLAGHRVLITKSIEAVLTSTAPKQASRY